MRTMTAPVAGLALVLTTALAGCSSKTGVAAAADAMGATNLNSIQFSGSGTNYAYGQAASAWTTSRSATRRTGRGRDSR